MVAVPELAGVQVCTRAAPNPPQLPVTPGFEPLKALEKLPPLEGNAKGEEQVPPGETTFNVKLPDAPLAAPPTTK